MKLVKKLERLSQFFFAPYGSPSRKLDDVKDYNMEEFVRFWGM